MRWPLSLLTRPESASSSASPPVSPPTTRRWPPGTKPSRVTTSAGRTGTVRRSCSESASTRPTSPPCRATAITAPSALSAIPAPPVPSAPTASGRPRRRLPARSQMNTVPSRLAVYSVAPSREIIGENTNPAWPDSLSPAAARRTSQTMMSPSSPVVITERPSGVKRASLTAAAWRPGGGADVAGLEIEQAQRPVGVTDRQGAVVAAQRVGSGHRLEPERRGRQRAADTGAGKALEHRERRRVPHRDAVVADHHHPASVARDHQRRVAAPVDAHGTGEATAGPCVEPHEVRRSLGEAGDRHDGDGQAVRREPQPGDRLALWQGQPRDQLMCAHVQHGHGDAGSDGPCTDHPARSRGRRPSGRRPG